MLHHALESVVEKFPHHTALSNGRTPISYQQLWDWIVIGADNLTRAGVREGDRVAILSDNCVDSVVAVWSIFRCNAIAVCLNEQLKPAALNSILTDVQARLVLQASGSSHASLSETVGEGLRNLSETMAAPDAADPDTRAPDAATRHSTPPDTQRSDDSAVYRSPAEPTDRIASIIYTSGSTGAPKGICLTHGNLLSVAGMAADGYAITEDDRYLMIVPLHYIHGLMILLALHLRGASIEFMNSFVFPGKVTERLHESRITGFSGVPFHFSALIDRGSFLDTELPSLRWVGVTGGTITPERIRQIRARKPALEIHISYGLTECSPRITWLNPAKIDRKPTSVGEVAKGLSVTFLDENGQAVKPGEIGELVVAGPNVMHGYWQDPALTSQVIDEHGRLHTGDLAYMDEEGDIFIKGRLQAMIKSAGERIFPEELEKLLTTHPQVSDAAVVGVDDPLYGQRVEAHIVLNESTHSEHDFKATMDAISRFCLSQVPLGRAPRLFHHWKAFPLKANGKVDKQQLVAATRQTVE